MQHDSNVLCDSYIESLRNFVELCSNKILLLKCTKVEENVTIFMQYYSSIHFVMKNNMMFDMHRCIESIYLIRHALWNISSNLGDESIIHGMYNDSRQTFTQTSLCIIAFLGKIGWMVCIRSDESIRRLVRTNGKQKDFEKEEFHHWFKNLVGIRYETMRNVDGIHFAKSNFHIPLGNNKHRFQWN